MVGALADYGLLDQVGLLSAEVAHILVDDFALDELVEGLGQQLVVLHFQGQRRKVLLPDLGLVALLTSHYVRYSAGVVAVNHPPERSVLQAHL